VSLNGDSQNGDRLKRRQTGSYGLGTQANSLNGPAVMTSTPSLLITSSSKTNVYGTAAIGLPINHTMNISICSMGIK